MLDHMHLYIQENPELKKGMVLALSGGVDSMTLLYLLLQTFTGPITLVHVDHMIRQDSPEDEHFVRIISERFSLPYYSKKVDIVKMAEEQKENIENMGRKVRYEFLEEIRKKTGSAVILTAHHGDDQVESMLMHLVRGSSFKGMTGLAQKKSTIHRPLLSFSKEQIVAYAKEHHIAWREDSTNEDTSLIRNRLRKEVLPVLAEINPQMHGAFMRFADEMKECTSLILEQLEEKLAVTTDWTGPFSFEKVQALSPFLRRNFLSLLIETFDDTFVSTNAHIHSRAEQLQHLPSGKRIYLTARLYIERSFDLLLLKEGEEEKLSHLSQTFSSIPSAFTYEDYSFVQVEHSEVILLEKTLLEKGFSLRTPEQHDRLRFFHHGKVLHKSLKKYAVEKSISSHDRKNLVCMVSNSSGEVLGILGQEPFCVGDAHLFIFYNQSHAVS